MNMSSPQSGSGNGRIPPVGEGAPVGAGGTRKKAFRPSLSSEAEMWQMPVSQVRVRAASPQHIRHLSLRQMPEGPLVGRIWSARTVDYKTLKPYPGGLFCESVFGPVQKGVCACGRTRLETKWRPTMVRQEIQRCPLCREETCSWRPRRDGTLACLPGPCPCGRTQPREVEYRTIRRVCVQCGGRTRDPIPPSLERDYQPGLCPCGKTTTEVARDDPVFCGYCGTEITLDPIARRYRLGYLPLATPVAHPWYYRGQPHVLGPLLGFSRRKLESLLKCEGGLANGLQLRVGFSTFSRTPKDFVPAERLARVEEPLERTKGRRLRRRRLLRPPPPPRRQARELRLVQHLVFAFPWYCFYRDSLWRPIPNGTRLENGGRDMEGLAALTNYILPEVWPGDRLLAPYRRLQPIEPRLLSDHSARTGGDVLLERLQEIDPIRWVTHARRALRMLDQEIAWFEGRPLRKNETVEYRRLLRQRGRLLRRLRIFAELRVSNVQPSWLMLQCLPVLPADLRPAIPMGNGLVMVSDVNKLYQRVVSRNALVAEIRRETTVQENASYRGDLRYAQRLLQEGVDALIENGRGGAKPETDARGRRLKSLAETLKGKRGRFRRNLLGKRVDYSGRSVIVSGPELSLHQCGLPRQMALTLLQPFLLRSLVGKVIDGRLLRTRWMARECLEKPTPSVWMEVMRAAAGLPILLNRAPTLHRLGFQAFQPRIISGRAILLHPLACSGFNADFDGDQMAVHIPLSSRARAEAWRLMTPGRHFFSPATGEAGFLPSQDMVLGAYYLTTSNRILWKKYRGLERHFGSLMEVEDAYERKEIHLHQPIWLKQTNRIDSDRLDAKTPTEPLEMRLHSDGRTVQLQLHRQLYFDADGSSRGQYVRTSVGRALVRRAVEESVQISRMISSLLFTTFHGTANIGFL